MTEEKQLLMIPGPTNVSTRVMHAMLRPVISHRGPEFHTMYESISEGLKYVFQTKQEVYVLTASGTGAVECAISNIVSPSDKVIVPVFGVFSERVRKKITYRGGQVVEIPVEWGKAPTAKQIEDAIKKERDVKMVAVVYNETSTGATVRELPEMARIARENNVLLMVDAISILGGDQLPVDEWGIDICVTGSQKCLACPPGLSMISVSERAWKAIEKRTAKPSYYFDLVSIRDFGFRKEPPFTPAIPLYYALDEALKMIWEEGLEKRYRRHAKCAKAFYSGLKALEVKPFPEENVCSNTVIAVNVPTEADSAKVIQTMRERYRVVISGGQGKLHGSIFRIGSMGIISEAKVLTTIKALENALADVKHPVKLGAGMEAASQVFRS